MPLFPLDLPVASLTSVLQTIVMVLFILSAFLLSVVILLQEGKGGGLSGAFGGAGADAFGVKAGTVNKFTAWLGAAFLCLALLHAGLVSASDTFSLDDDSDTPSTSSLMPGEDEEADLDGAPAGDADGDPKDGDTGGDGDEPKDGDTGDGNGGGDEPKAPGDGSGDDDEKPADAPKDPAPGDDG